MNQFKGLDHRILTTEEEKELAHKIANGCQASRDYLIEHNLRLVVSIANSYANSNVPLEDIIQAGNIGLIKAVDKFNPKLGKLSTYATRWILAEISILFDNVDRPMDLPMQTARAIREIDRVELELTQKLGREPALEEVIEGSKKRKAVKNAKKDMSDLLSLRERYSVYLDNEMSDLESVGGESLKNLIPDHDAEDPEILAVHRDLVEKLIVDLSDREKYILRLYYGLDGQPHTLKQIAFKIGVGEQRVQQIHAAIMKQLRTKAEKNEELFLALQNL